MEYESLSNEDLVALIMQGNDFLIEKLITRCEPIIKNKLKNYSFDVNAYDDMVQRGRIAVFKAIQKYDCNHKAKAKFATFVSTCLDNEFKSAITKINKQNGDYIVSSILDLSDNDKSPYVFDARYNPEEIAINKEAEQEIKTVAIEILSSIEQKVYSLKNIGYKNGDISKELKISTKSVENALTRIKQKFSKKLKTKESK